MVVNDGVDGVVRQERIFAPICSVEGRVRLKGGCFRKVGPSILALHLQCSKRAGSG